MQGKVHGKMNSRMYRWMQSRKHWWKKRILMMYWWLHNRECSLPAASLLSRWKENMIRHQTGWMQAVQGILPMWIMPMYFTRYRWMIMAIRLFICMVMGSPVWDGWQLRTGVKDGLTCFWKKDMRHFWWISRDAARREQPHPWQRTDFLIHGLRTPRNINRETRRGIPTSESDVWRRSGMRALSFRKGRRHRISFSVRWRQIPEISIRHWTQRLWGL